jgi:hypothetical protein
VIVTGRPRSRATLFFRRGRHGAHRGQRRNSPASTASACSSSARLTLFATRYIGTILNRLG